MTKRSAKNSVFAVGIAALGQDRPVLLSETIYKDALAARANLVALTHIEMSYDLIIRNFSALMELQPQGEADNELAQLRLRSGSMPWVQEFNKCVGNLLSSIKGYFDQTDRILTKVFGRKSPERSSFKAQWDKQRDTVLSHRLMWEVRNYNQHYSMAVHSVTVITKWGSIKIDPPRFVLPKVSAVPFFNKARLMENPSLAKKLQKDLPNLPEKIKVLPHIQEYVETVSAIQQHVRTLAESSIVDWTDKLEVSQAVFAKAYPTKELTRATPISLFEFPNEEFEEALSTTTISGELFEFRNLLASKNRKLSNLETET